jgi:hypothetical protein
LSGVTALSSQECVRLWKQQIITEVVRELCLQAYRKAIDPSIPLQQDFILFLFS